MLDLLETPITVIHVFVCLLLMLVVLIQPGKSGGLGAALGGAGAQQLFGGRGAGNFLSRATWISAVVFFVTSITLAYLATSTGDSLQDAVAAEPARSPEVVPPKSTTNDQVDSKTVPSGNEAVGASAPGANTPVVEDSELPVAPQPPVESGAPGGQGSNSADTESGSNP